MGIGSPLDHDPRDDADEGEAYCNRCDGRVLEGRCACTGPYVAPARCAVCGHVDEQECAVVGHAEVDPAQALVAREDEERARRHEQADLYYVGEIEAAHG